MVPIQPEKGDDPAIYQTATCHTPGKAPYLILDREPNGDCVYLRAGTCTIYDHRPYACREFDCRELFLGMDRRERKLAGKRDIMMRGVLNRGHELLKGKA